MSEQKPEAVWVFPEEPKRRGGRIAIVSLIVVLALIAAGVVALFLIPRGDGAPGPTTSPTTSPSTTPATSSPAPTDATGAPTTAPTTAPPVPDPSLDSFRDAVGFRLDTADQGLDMIAQGGSDTSATVQKLQEDAQRLLDTPAPTSIASKWRDALQSYAAHLDALAGNPSDSGAISGARADVGTMKGLIGV